MITIFMYFWNNNIDLMYTLTFAEVHHQHTCNTAKQLGFFTTFLGCNSVTKECYQIGFIETSLRSFFFGYSR